MKIGKIPSLGLIILASFTLAMAQPPRYVERQSTDPGRDLERVSVKGTIEKIEGGKALLRTHDGAEVTVNLGPQQYWHEKGYRLRTGVVATVDGWGDMYDEDGGFIFAGSIYGDGFYFELSDSRGYPRWADRDDWRDDWCPRMDYYQMYYYGPRPWRAHWWLWGPPPPPRPHWGWHHQDRPGWHDGHGRHDRHDRHDRPGPPPPPRHRGHPRGRY